MRPNVKFNNKTKNSFVYFQLGLIVTMVAALFVLEYNFETIKSTTSKYVPEVDIEAPFVYNPIVNVSKPVAEVSPVMKSPKVTSVFKAVKNDKVVEPVANVIPAVDNTIVSNTLVEPVSVIVNTSPTAVVSEYTAFSVEQLPMFEACKGLRREEQKKCFDEELAKAVFKNIEYPANDFENGKQGTALIEFVIDENGYITNVKALDNKRATLDMQRAAEKAFRKIPKIIPAKQGSENVKIKYLMPVSFKLK